MYPLNTALVDAAPALRDEGPDMYSLSGICSLAGERLIRSIQSEKLRMMSANDPFVSYEE
jgi:hypothetical protein